jgi:hypothetical protein
MEGNLGANGMEPANFDSAKTMQFWRTNEVSHE